MADIDVGVILEALNNKADLDLNNTAFEKLETVSGTLKWDGVNVLTAHGGDLLRALRLSNTQTLATSANETEIMLRAGSSTENGALFAVYGKNGVSPGKFLARSANSSGTFYDLIGSPDGVLTWGGKQVLREQAGSLGANGYIKLNTGVIIQWGQQQGRTVTFPTPFSGDYSYSVMGAIVRSSSTSDGWNYVHSTTTTGFKFVVGTDNEWFHWIAIGF